MPRLKSSKPVDKHVANRVRMRRIMLDMSQTALGDLLGLSFQTGTEIRERQEPNRREPIATHCPHPESPRGILL
jgi:DNA-binding XRE family transcriptional regulator